MKNILLLIFLSNLSILIKCFTYDFNSKYYSDSYQNSYSNNQAYSNFFLSNTNTKSLYSYVISNYFISNHLTSKYLTSKYLTSKYLTSKYLTSKSIDFNKYLSIILSSSLQIGRAHV